MTLLNAILKKVTSSDIINKKYSSPPPELDTTNIVKKKKRKQIDQYSHISCKVDTSPPLLDKAVMFRNLDEWTRRNRRIHLENINLLINIKRQHFSRGKVDSRWTKLPASPMRRSDRSQFFKRTETDNAQLYKRIKSTRARVQTREELIKNWYNQHPNEVRRQNRVSLDTLIEDSTYITVERAKLPKVYITLKVREGAVLGVLPVELFVDRCPQTCKLFIDLLDGDGLGHGYVGTQFFTKVPGLYWRGGDVIHNNGFGCYAQKGRQVPIGAENYHYSHSKPGLLSMRVTKDDEMCGIFNITFKALPQIDLRNVVFGRVKLPCKTFNVISGLGSALSTRPIVEIFAAKRRAADQWVYGQPNTKIKTNNCDLK